ncbi:MAG: SAM hydrolase/SAM-dependent halogenase family protein, partial [Acidimicrobiales bacterium]
DYGSGGGFVGALHAVIDRIAPQARVVDLDHAIPPQDVVLGALRLESMMSYCAEGVHVGVVDPGVGGERRAVAVKAGGSIFVGPDNGLLIFAAEAVGGCEQAVELTDTRFLLPDPARTFDGRDVFAPVAAHLASGVAFAELGPAVPPEALARLVRPGPRWLSERKVELEIVQVDHFGNMQLSGGSDVTKKLALAEATATGGGNAPAPLIAVSLGSMAARRVPLGKTFAEVPVGSPVILVDSDSRVAISVNCGRADELFQAVRGDRLVLEATSG